MYTNDISSNNVSINNLYNNTPYVLMAFPGNSQPRIVPIKMADGRINFKDYQDHCYPGEARFRRDSYTMSQDLLDEIAKRDSVNGEKFPFLEGEDGRSPKRHKRIYNAHIVGHLQKGGCRPILSKNPAERPEL